MITFAIQIPWTALLQLDLRSTIQLVEDSWFKLMSELGDDYVVIETKQYKYDSALQVATVLEATCWCWDA